MTELLRFQTRARTIDHLGREQIADCPTAISELWKNAYDAYARATSLQIFDGDIMVAAIYDDGHGMSREEFVSKWLVVGTESKVWSETPTKDRNGLSRRNKQGKKGIGRLSVGYLGNLLLLVSKREDNEYVASLIDWRIFENPFLLLDDIRIPMVTFAEKGQLLAELPNLYDTLMGNVWGDADDKSRADRIVEAWKSFDSLENPESSAEKAALTTRSRIEKTLIVQAFTERHLAQWAVWMGSAKHGTAMLLSGVIPDVEAQIRTDSLSATDETSRTNLRSTLWSFVDPFRELVREPHEAIIEDFSTSVFGWKGDQRLAIIDRDAGFEAQSAENLEHIIDGRVDENGVFRGRVKAFGEWLAEDVEIAFEEAISTRVDTRVGAFDFYVGTMEFDRANSTLPDELYSSLVNLLERFSGLMVFRDGFRVMPYGRTDSDYFNVEERRSKNAGREFWNHRRMLGRIAISNSSNPNLRDKAGREGIIDNRASKVFRAIVISILTNSARLFFGSSSQLRKDKLPELQEAYSNKLKQEERERILKQKRRQFRARLEGSYATVEQLSERVGNFNRNASEVLQQNAEPDIVELQKSLSSLKLEHSSLRLGPPPKDLSSKLRKTYSDYRALLNEIDESLISREKEINEALERLNPRRPQEIARDSIETQLRHVRRRLYLWTTQIEKLLDSEKERVEAHAKSRAKLLQDQLVSVPNDVQAGTLKLGAALSLIETKAAEHDLENESQMQPIISALESLAENINLDLLAADSSEEVGGLRTEIDRLTALAQLGITVEIIDHELASFNSTIAHGLKQFSSDVQKSIPFKQVQTGYEGLSSRLSFLSPLKLSGDPDYRHITGRDIEDYVLDFFAADIKSGSFRIVVDESFRKFSVYEQRARIFPVFINLINNARYWLHQKDIENRTVELGVVSEKVLVSDNGPGIDPQDIPDLFRLFFTRRQGGRGIGLYLCRSNLAAGGHRISYATDSELRLLDGATFAIEFREASFTE